MSDDADLEAELLALQAALQQHEPPPKPAAKPSADELAKALHGEAEASRAQILRVIEEVRGQIAALGGEVEETVAAHPMAAVAAAFTLGFVAGQLAGRRHS